jgi:hypothetical protein
LKIQDSKFNASLFKILWLNCSAELRLQKRGVAGLAADAALLLQELSVSLLAATQLCRFEHNCPTVL